MKRFNVGSSRRPLVVLLAALSLSATAFADVPDKTGAMQFLCNPNKSRWRTNSANDGRARSMTMIVPYRGRLYVSGGCWDPNMGYAPIFAVDPATGSFTNEFSAGTERIDFFRKGSDGRLYAGGLDVHERSPAAKQGAYFRRDLDGTWSGLAANVGLLMHVWDICCWKGNVFTAGYGIFRAPESSAGETSNALPADFDTLIYYTKSSGAKYRVGRRFYAFLPFKDDLFCIPFNFPYLEAKDLNPFEEWRFNKSTGVFSCETRPWSEIAPNVETNDMLAVGTAVKSDYAAPVSVLPFKGRVVYIFGSVSTESTRPWCLYSAENVNHHVKATKAKLGDGVYPFCISKYVTRSGVETLNVLAAQFDSASRTVVNSVWESRDGVSFKKLFTFKTGQQASAICRTDAGFYVGIGWRFTTTWNLACKDGSSGNAGDDVSGDIYKIPL